MVPAAKNLRANIGNLRDAGLIPGKIPWRRKWQPTPLFLPREFHGQSSLVGYSPQGSRESDMTEATLHIAHTANLDIALATFPTVLFSY